MPLIREIGNGFFHVRTPLVMFGLIDIKTHMSFIKLPTGKFLAIDTVEVTPQLKAEIDQLTQQGSLLEAVIATHPYHTLYFQSFYNNYPQAKYYGTGRHLKINKVIPWAGDIETPEIRNQWNQLGVEIRIPEGCDFLPANDNHFAGAFVYHRDSKTVFIDDTFGFFEDAGCLLRIVGGHRMHIHPDLEKSVTSADQFKNFVNRFIQDWDFDNMVMAHGGNKLGDAKSELVKLMNAKAPTLDKLAAKNRKGK